jgi:ribosomal protein S18 acetylase RimI-like enzyme
VDQIVDLRRATAEDADAILDLHLLVDLAEIGEHNTSIDEVTGGLANTSMEAVVVDDPRGGLLGHAWAVYEDGHEKSWGDFAARPGADRDVAPALVDWVVATAQRLAPGKPLHVFADSASTTKRRLYEGAGATMIRRFYRMGVRFDTASQIPAPTLPAGYRIRGVTNNEADLRAVHGIVDTAFRDHFAHDADTYEQWRRRHVDGACPDLTLWWLATKDGVPAAALYAAPIGESGYVDTLGTLREHRRLGLGRALLLTAFAEFYRRGLRKVVLGVDAESPTGAVGLYTSVGMVAEHEGLQYEIR